MKFRCVRNFVVAVLTAAVALLMVGPPALANHEHSDLPDMDGRGVGNQGNGKARDMLAGQALDLTSTTQSIEVSKKYLPVGSTADITVGDTTRTIQTGDLVTPAELVALRQVLMGGFQAITLNDSGAAIGGAFSVAALRGPPLLSLVIPEGVSAIGIAGANPLRIRGELINFGNLIGIESHGTRPFFINTGDLQVAIGGLVSTIIPESLQDLVNVSNRPVDMFIRSFQGVDNAGAITASGLLKIWTQLNIVNALPPGAPEGTPLPVIAGNLGVNLQSVKGSIINSGIIGAPAGDLVATARNGLLTVGDGASFFAGTLAGGAPATGVLAPKDIDAAGLVSLIASSTTIGDEASFTSNGDDLILKAMRGDLTMGDDNQFQANGGNVLLFARGAVTGGEDNSFVARAVGTGNKPVQSSGGGIEIGAGLTNSSALSAAFNGPGGIAPPASDLGSNVVINNNGGVVLVNTKNGGTVDLSVSGLHTATLTLNRGAIIFDARGNSVQFDGGTFTTDAFRPVSYVEKQEEAPAHTGWTVDTGDALVDNEADEGPVAIVE